LPPRAVAHAAARALPILFGLFTIRMFPHMLLAIPFFVMGSFLTSIDLPIRSHPGAGGDQPAIHDLADVQFLPEIPRDLDEAAAIDGCNLWQTFRIVILPLVRPGLTVAALFSLLFHTMSFSLPSC
jgi:multiple sugar transport system permease protein